MSKEYFKSLTLALALLMQGTAMADDLTGRGRNMSFEDLSAQGGQPTGGVVDVPTGWNAYINGKQVFTASDVRTSGVTAWFGINDDSEGDPKDGNYSFGLWNPSVPSFELSQTIDGLENGTYLIKAALMVGANSSGSRRTTQRIFGNLNVRYFGSAEEYDAAQFAPSEIYSFEGLEEPFTDRLLQEISLRVFVFDGTLTFGLRTDANLAAAMREVPNDAGGDGWFKVDNFRIEQASYEPADAMAVYEYYRQKAESMLEEDLSELLFSELQKQLEARVYATNSMAEIVSAIQALKSICRRVEAAANANEHLQEALEEAYEASIVYDLSFKQLGKETIDEVANALLDLIDEAESLLDEGAADDETMDTLAQQLLDAAAQLRKLCQPLEMVQNMSFEDLSTQGGQQTGSVANVPAGWNAYINGTQVFTADDVRNNGVTGWFGVNDDSEGDAKDGSYSFGLWNGRIPRFELSQTVDGLDNGTYLITAALMVGANGSGSRRTTQRIFGNLNARYFGNAEEYDAAQLDQNEVCSFEGLEEPVTDRLLQEVSVRAFVYDGTLTFGVRTDGKLAANLYNEGNSAGGDGWLKVDNFRIEPTDYDAEDALSVYRHFFAQAKQTAENNLPQSLLSELNDIEGRNINVNSSMDDIASAIRALLDLCPRLKATAREYNRLQTAIAEAEKALSASQSHQDDQMKSVAAALQTAIDEATQMRQQTTATDEQVSHIYQQLQQTTIDLNRLCLTEKSIMIDGIYTETDFYFENWDGYWFDQNDDLLDKDASAYDYVWMKYSDVTANVTFGIVYGEWVRTNSWSEDYYSDEVIIDKEMGVVGIPLEKAKVCRKGEQNTESPFWGDVYAKHVRQVYVMARGTETAIKIEGIWFGTKEEYQKAAGIDDTTVQGLIVKTSDDNTVYDLTGRRMQGKLTPGIYIRGGRKILVK